MLVWIHPTQPYALISPSTTPSGMGVIIGYLFEIDNAIGAIWISMAVILIYTVCGGLFSVAYTDLFQSAVGWLGCLILAFWSIKNEPSAAPPSIGFPGYIYPDLIGEGGVCDMYNGVACDNNATACCYNPANELADNGAYPFGDLPKFSDQMTNAYSLTPFPNAIFFNWATIFVLGKFVTMRWCLLRFLHVCVQYCFGAESK